MFDTTKTQMLMQADMLCLRLGIAPNQNDIVLLIGDEKAVNNLEAVFNWVATQPDLDGKKRDAVQTELYDRLVELLDSRVVALSH